MESAAERGKRLFAEHSKALPRIFGNPLMRGIGAPDDRLTEESLGHIAAYSLGYLQELSARVQLVCEDPRETPEHRREACQLLVNVATDATADIHLLSKKFPEPFRAIAEVRSNFPCLFPAHPKQRAALSEKILKELKLGELHPLKLRTRRKTFSIEGTNRLLFYYIRRLHDLRTDLLAVRLSNPYELADVPRHEIERLVDDIPLSVDNAKPWIDAIWGQLLLDIPKPETHPRLRSLGERPSRSGRGGTGESPSNRKRRRRAPKAIDKASGYIRSAIKEALKKYLIRLLRPGIQSDK